MKRSPNVDEQFSGQDGAHDSGHFHGHQAKVNGGQGIHLLDVFKRFGGIHFAQVVLAIDIK